MRERERKTNRHQLRLKRSICDQSAKSDHQDQGLGSDGAGHRGGGQEAQCPAEAAFQDPRSPALERLRVICPRGTSLTIDLSLRFHVLVFVQVGF